MTREQRRTEKNIEKIIKSLLTIQCTRAKRRAMPKTPAAEKIQLLLEGEITTHDDYRPPSGLKTTWGKSTYKAWQPWHSHGSMISKGRQVYEALAGLEMNQENVKPYLLVWLHGMDNGSIEPGYLTTIQRRLRHRVIFMVPMSPRTHEGVHFNWGCAFTKRDNKKQLGTLDAQAFRSVAGFVHGRLHEASVRFIGSVEFNSPCKAVSGD